MHYTADSIWTAAGAERAFAKAVRARRRASFARRVLHRCVECARLCIIDEGSRRPQAGGVREIPLDAITATFEPNRAEQFDSAFRPSPKTRCRWMRVWQAEERGMALPPIIVAAVGGAYAIRDGHHRVSVARARGGMTITALVS